MDYYRYFRINAPKHLEERVKELLWAQGFEFEVEKFSPLACKLISEPFPLGHSLAAFFGYIYIQDRSSMLPPLALAPATSSIVLDMCASPGGKTGFLAQLVGPAGLVIANEPNPSRLAALRRNMAHMNLFQVVTSGYQANSLPLPPSCFDYILLDPPCSAWGTTNKHPNVLKLWRGEKIRPLIKLQRSLLREAFRLLKPGGYLVYSTCTVNTKENEEQITFACDELGFELTPLNPPPGIHLKVPSKNIDGVWCVDGKASQSQGFFVARLKRPNPGYKKALNFMPDFVRYKDRPCIYEADTYELSAEDIYLAGIDTNLPTPGKFVALSGRVFFLPQRAQDFLPASFVWQGLKAGKYSEIFRPSGRLHPASMENLPPRGLSSDSLPPCLKFEDLADITTLIKGISIDTSLSGNRARLFWRDLPLGFVNLKNGRVVLSLLS